MKKIRAVCEWFAYYGFSGFVAACVACAAVSVAMAAVIASEILGPFMAPELSDCIAVISLKTMFASVFIMFAWFVAITITEWNEMR